MRPVQWGFVGSEDAELSVDSVFKLQRLSNSDENILPTIFSLPAHSNQIKQETNLISETKYKSKLKFGPTSEEVN